MRQCTHHPSTLLAVRLLAAAALVFPAASIAAPGTMPDGRPWPVPLQQLGLGGWPAQCAAAVGTADPLLRCTIDVGTPQALVAEFSGIDVSAVQNPYWGVMTSNVDPGQWVAGSAACQQNPDSCPTFDARLLLLNAYIVVRDPSSLAMASFSGWSSNLRALDDASGKVTFSWAP